MCRTTLSRSRIAGVTLASLAAVPCAAALAPQDPAATYPSRPIRIVIGFSAGSTVDVSARVIGQKMTETWKQQVVADNRPSAGGIIAAQTVAHANPDGYTLLSVSASHAVAPAMYSKLPYDTAKDFAGITTTVSVPAVLIVAPSLGVKTVKDLVSMAKAKPGQINFSSAGVGSATHFSAELFKSLAGINVQHVPYKGIPEAVTEAMLGRVQFMLSPMSNAMPFIKEGRLVALAVSPAKRLAVLPNVPTIAEAGVPGYEWQTWFGLLAPAKTPRPIIAKLNREVTRILNLPESKERWNALGCDPVPIAPEAFDKFVVEQIALFTKLARAANIKAD
ncbi:MAG TPA: tripartite tricarboxylate transporter substrate binding protein [Burkholderiales bacterium]|nr:tripartite tricarboxylate transporter substrate binding protein [Burkholderiales bacterium]